VEAAVIRILLACLSGGLFALGLELGGMTSTAKVRGFLDVFGQFDPQLAFVMAGALLVAVPGELWLRRKRPRFTPALEMPRTRALDAPLFAGAALFGAGWGLVGLCPAPAVVLLGSLRPEVLLFCAAMLGGMALAEPLRRRTAHTEPPGPLSADARGSHPARPG
jgi:uncharacterized membrane protein YedE/YeeE